jgi:aryl-alcohol dehydrogenase-like predicted oxidoreductase
MLRSILELAEQSQITTLDTAAAYGNAEERLGNHLIKPFRIVSKFPNVTTEQQLTEYFFSSVQRLKAENLYGYLAHHPRTLIDTPGLWDTLLTLKQEHRILKAGFSLYTTEELDQLLHRGIVPDLIQVPYSLFDRKFESYFPELKAQGVEIHTRSAFLQGLYFMDPLALNDRLLPLQPALNKLHEVIADHGQTIENVALQFVSKNPYLDQVVIGVDSPQQLQSNILSVESEAIPEGLFHLIREIPISHPELLNPATWHA